MNYSKINYTIKSRNLPIISCTDEHPFYVLRDDKFEWVRAKDLEVADTLVESKMIRNVPTPDAIEYIYYTF